MAVWFLELVGGAPFTEALCVFGVSASEAVSEQLVVATPFTGRLTILGVEASAAGIKSKGENSNL